MSKTTDRRQSASDKARGRAALRDAVPFVVVIVALQVPVYLLNPNGERTAWFLVWSFAPLVPVLWFMWAQVRSLRRADEYQRMRQLEAMAVGFGTMILLSLAGGLLEVARMGDPRQSLQVTFIGGVLAWIGTSVFKASR